MQERDHYLIGEPDVRYTRGQVEAVLRKRNATYRPWRPEPATIKGSR